MSIRKKYLLLFLILQAMGFPLNSFAEGGGSQLGFIYGLSVPDSENTNPHHLYGVKGSALINPMFAIGGYYLVSGQEDGRGGQEFAYSLHGIETALHLPSGSGDTFVGFRMGMTKVRTTDTGSDLLFSPYHYGLVSGYDYALFSWLTFGFEGSYIHIQKSRTTNENVIYYKDSFNVINFLITLQFKL